jgi:hypothetical protein
MEGLKATAEFECPSCHQQVQAIISVPGPDLGAERISDMTIVEAVDVECPVCGEVFTGEAAAGIFDCQVKLDDYSETQISTHVQHEPDEPWDDYEPPEDPHDTYRSSRAEAADLLKEHGGGGSDLINRMVFAHYIGAMEAYLGDTFRNMIVSNPKAVSRLVALDRKLNEEKFTLAEIDSSPDLLKTRVLLRLRSVMWHNLKSVSALYNQAFEIDLLKKLGDNYPLLDKAIEYRHDCVHRNGFDRDKNKLTVFTQGYVESVGAIIDDLVTEIEGEFDGIRASIFLGGSNSSAGSGR